MSFSAITESIVLYIWYKLNHIVAHSAKYWLTLFVSSEIPFCWHSCFVWSETTKSFLFIEYILLRVWQYLDNLLVLKSFLSVSYNFISRSNLMKIAEGFSGKLLLGQDYNEEHSLELFFDLFYHYSKTDQCANRCLFLLK